MPNTPPPDQRPESPEALRGTDRLLDALGGRDNDQPETLTADPLHALLAAWRTEADSVPAPELVSTDQALDTIASATRPLTPADVVTGAAAFATIHADQLGLHFDVNVATRTSGVAFTLHPLVAPARAIAWALDALDPLPRAGHTEATATASVYVGHWIELKVVGMWRGLMVAVAVTVRTEAHRDLLIDAMPEPRQRGGFGPIPTSLLRHLAQEGA